MRNLVTRWIGIATLICLQVGQASSSPFPPSPEDNTDALRKVGAVLAQPPLIPIPSDLPPAITSDSNIMTVRFAAKAGVALIQTSQAVELVDLGTSKQIFRYQVAPGQPGSLSPNGRLFTSNDNGHLSIRDSQTGIAIANIPSVWPWEFHWLDDRTAFYNDQKHTTYFIDFSSGKTIATGLLNFGIFQSALIPGQPNQYAILTPNKVFQFELIRNKPVPELKLLAEKVVRLPGLSSGSSTTSDGKYFFSTSSHLSLLNLNSLESEEISLEPFYFQTGMATPAADEIIVTGFIQPHDGSEPQEYLYSINKHSLAQIKRDTQSNLPRRTYISPLRKLGIIGGNQITLMESPQMTEITPLADFKKKVASKSEQNKVAIAEKQQALVNSCLPSKEKNKDGIELQAVGVYEGASGQDKDTNNKVDIAVYESDHPLVLALFSYVPVTWNITLNKGSALREVILRASDNVKFSGTKSNTVKVTRQNFGSTAYENCDFFRMVAPKLKEFSGLNVTTFQGTYHGIGFAIRSQYQPISQAPAAQNPTSKIQSDPELEVGLAAYEQGKFRTALERLMPLAEKNVAMAQNTIGKMYLQGQEVQQNYSKALLLFQKAAQQNLPNAQNNLGVMFAGGYGVPQDFKQAIAWFERAANQGYVIAMNNLADIYEGGVGARKDPIAAEQWRNRTQGQASSPTRREITVELSGSKDYKKGLALYQDFRLREAFCPLLSSAEKGNPEAQLKLESMYRNGQHVEKDESQAAYWKKRASDRQQELTKQALSGVAAAKELPGSKDYKAGIDLYNKGRRWEAFCLLHAAAQEGQPDAQLKLQAMYESGEGGEKDERHAEYWGKKAEVQGYSNKDGRDRIYIIETPQNEPLHAAPAPRYGGTVRYLLRNPTEGTESK